MSTRVKQVWAVAPALILVLGALMLSACSGAASSPTPHAQPTATTAPMAGPPPAQGAARDLLQALPTLEDLPPGLALTVEERRSMEEVAATFEEPPAVLERLSHWGFQQAAFRKFDIPAPGLNDTAERMLQFRASAIEFGSAEAADTYMEFNRDALQQLEGADLADVSAERLGDRSIAAQGTISVDGQVLRMAALWVRQGTVVYAFAGIAREHNAMVEITDIAKRTLE